MVNLDEFKYGGTNLTAFRLLDPDRPEVQKVVQDWIHGELRFGRKLDVAGQGIKVKQCSTTLKSLIFPKFPVWTAQ